MLNSLRDLYFGKAWTIRSFLNQERTMDELGGERVVSSAGIHKHVCCTRRSIRMNCEFRRAGRIFRLKRIIR